MPEPQRRADAVANRDRIVEAARAIMATSDEFKLNAVAKKAGIGQGTLYRHFPTREALLAEVYRSDVEDLVAAASSLLEQYPPIEALDRWFHRVADYAKVKRDVFAAVEVAVWSDLSEHSQGPIGDALTLLLDAGKREGSVRADVDARDVVLLIGYLSRITQLEAEQRGRHLLAIVLDGLRSRPPDRLMA
jgi:AcrR family transcriptional regulator